MTLPPEPTGDCIGECGKSGINMNATVHLRELQPFDPAWLVAGIESYRRGIAVAEKGRIVYANRAFEIMSGCDQNGDVMRGQLFTNVLPHDTHYRKVSGAKDSVATNRQQLEALVTDFVVDARPLQMVSVRPIWSSGSEGGEISQVPGIAHDFGNVLTGILLYSDLLTAGLAGDPGLLRHAEAVGRSVRDGVKLVHKLIPGAKEEPDSATILSLNQIVSEMATHLGRMVGEAIEIESRLYESLGLVRLEASECKRVILNLAMNARDAMPAGGKIVLSTRNCFCSFAKSAAKSPPVACVELSIADTGTGMDQETQAQAFRPFFTTKPRNKGSGIGLTVVRKIVEQAGGKVEIRSDLGKGTWVGIVIPRVDVMTS